MPSRIQKNKFSSGDVSNEPMPQNTVVREVRSNSGQKLGLVLESHDGTTEGIVAAAQRATERMYAEYAESSNVQSRIVATNASGLPKWAVSPNFQVIAEIGTSDSDYIWSVLPKLDPTE